MSGVYRNEKRDYGRDMTKGAGTEYYIEGVGEPLLLTASEVAKRLALGKATVYRLMANGDLPLFRNGRSVRVPAQALQEWVLSRTIRGKDGQML
jgi:excisionase family DNA binding protein